MPIRKECREKADDFITLLMIVDAIGDWAYKEDWAAAWRDAKVLANLADRLSPEYRPVVEAQLAEIRGNIRRRLYGPLLDILDPTRETIIDNMLNEVVKCECER